MAGQDSSSDLFQRMGGTAGCHALSTAFYSRVPKDSVLRPLFPGKTQKCAIEAFSAFLVQFLGGPPADTQHRWFLSLQESHGRFQIGPRQRDAWMRTMNEALKEAPFEDSVRAALLEFFEHSSTYLVNSGESPLAPVAECAHVELAARWNAQLAMDSAVAAIRMGDLNRAVALAGSEPLRGWLAERRAVFAQLLATMIETGQRGMVDYVREQLTGEPSLAQERYSGRTLLYSAAGAGNWNIVELLLSLGADPNVQSDGGHTPLYAVANGCTPYGGASVVMALVAAGAKVDACDGVKHCTPLHMAARRGNVTVAGALLDCGANIEARDSAGDTPLRRAVNCGKTEVAELLLARGANVKSIGSKGLTPAVAARTAAMRRVLACYPGV